MIDIKNIIINIKNLNTKINNIIIICPAQCDFAIEARQTAKTLCNGNPNRRWLRRRRRDSMHFNSG